MVPDFEAKLNEYAHLLVEVGMNLQPGQTPRIIEQFEPASCQIWRRDAGALRRLYGRSRYTVTVLMPLTGSDPDGCAKLWSPWGPGPSP